MISKIVLNFIVFKSFTKLFPFTYYYLQFNLVISWYILDVSLQAEYRFGSCSWQSSWDCRLVVCLGVALPAGCNWLQGADRRCSPACYQTDGQLGKHSSVTCLTRSRSCHLEWAWPVEMHKHKRTHIGVLAQARTLISLGSEESGSFLNCDQQMHYSASLKRALR